MQLPSRRTPVEVEILSEWMLLHPLFSHLHDRSQLEILANAVTGVKVCACVCVCVRRRARS
jgi:hypothetical protein